jgi:hypothetical protein
MAGVYSLGWWDILSGTAEPHRQSINQVCSEIIQLFNVHRATWLHSRTAALGHKQTYHPILPQCLLPGVKQPFIYD